MSRKFINFILNVINCVMVSINLNLIYMYLVNFVMEIILVVYIDYVSCEYIVYKLG